MKIAILGNYSTQFLVKSIKIALKNNGYIAEIYEGSFDAIDLELIDEGSGLYDFKPEIILIHESDYQLRKYFYNLSDDEKGNFSEIHLATLKNRIEILQRQIPTCRIIYPEIIRYNDSIYGNLYSKIEHSWYFQIQRLSYYLLNLALEESSFYIIDSTCSYPEIKLRDWTQINMADLQFSIPYLNYLSERIVIFLGTFEGQFKKCIILDLDNTLWGGIIGDDGLEGIQLGNSGIGKAFVNFQKWIKQLQKRGIIIAVCSKNDEMIAKSAFENHPDMVLSLKDISVFIANWNSKADNINLIQEVLNIGFDSMVFIDDNPAEREIVRRFLPSVTVPELPEDPSEYLPYLISINLFETSTYSANDLVRTQQYQEEAQRVTLAKSVTNMDDYLISLNMQAKVERFLPPNFERISQLIQRSNQFNLRTIRYTPAEIKELSSNPNMLSYSVELRDKFGDYGLISLAIVALENNTARIDSWIMSCRVLKRNVEQLLMNIIIEDLKQKNIDILHGEYIQTKKNNLVANLLNILTFKQIDENNYILNISDYIDLTTKITYEINLN